MKKIFSILLTILVILSSVPAFAQEDYIRLTPYPYSSHLLGEDLVIYGDTSLDKVTLGFYYPEENGYFGYAKYIMIISAQELRAGYVIQTETVSRLWPEGIWTVRVQSGDVSDTLKIPMSADIQYDRSVKIAVYESDVLQSVTSYPCRGITCKDNVISFSLEDGSEIKIFSWNNFAPTDSGKSRIYIAHYKDGYMTDIKTYEGILSGFEGHFTLKVSENKTVKLFYWANNLAPVQ